jgi:hypothetical protein
MDAAMSMITQKSKSKVKKKKNERKQKIDSPDSSLQTRSNQLENYKSFFQYLLSNKDLDDELIDES